MDTPDENSRPYTAVVYFHGMGSQRRYEESSRLIDSIDTHLRHEFPGGSGPRLKDIGPGHEPGLSPGDRDVTYLRAVYEKDGEPDQEVRIYEAYWAPIMANTSSSGAVAKWILRQVRRPLASFFANWMDFTRLRRSLLSDMMDRKGGHKAEHIDDYEALCMAYADFCDRPEVPAIQGRKFAAFKQYLGETFANDADQRDRVTALARSWWWHFLRTEALNLLFLLTILLAILMSLAACIWGAMVLVEWISSTVASVPPLTEGSGGSTGSAGPAGGASTAGVVQTGGDPGTLGTWLSGILSPLGVREIAPAVIGIVMALGVRKFLTDYMGDVEAWSTYQETDVKYDKRKAVIALGSKVTTHVLSQENCERAIVVSHSLGTSVALDTLLAMVNANRVKNPTDPISGVADLSKIRFLVTAGCPVDKINYFFETYRTGSRNYSRVVEGLRGDIGTEPFSRGGKPQVTWVNYWDRGDIISGPIHSAVARRTLKRRVDNVHVAGMKFPNPAGSHTGYFRDRTIVSNICGMIFDDAYDSTAGAPSKDEGKCLSLGIYLLAGSLPWLALVYIALALFGIWATFASFVFWAAMTIGSVLLLINLALLTKKLFSGYDGRRNPI